MSCKNFACENCRYLLWMIGIGGGLRCSHEKNLVDGKAIYIKSRKSTCEYFELKNNNGKVGS